VIVHHRVGKHRERPTGLQRYGQLSAIQHLRGTMAPRPYWRGYLRLSLVTCPVLLYPATTQAEKTHFHQINKRTGNRLHQQMIDERTGKVVDRDDKGRGYELSKGKYVEIEEDELEAVQIESTHTIEIDTFVPKEEIDQRYLDKPYYIVPSGEKVGEEAFAVIRDAMKNKGRVALARIVMAHREHVIAIEPMDKGMVGTTLRYPYELRDSKPYFSDIHSPRLPRDMVKLAEHILETKEGHFDPSRFKDEYETALKALVRRKAKGKTIEVPEERPEQSNVIDLMEALRQSVKGEKGSKRARGPSKSKRRKTSSTRRRKAA
jgi:DNA end-binding protein Ku